MANWNFFLKSDLMWMSGMHYRCSWKIYQRIPEEIKIAYLLYIFCHVYGMIPVSICFKYELLHSRLIAQIVPIVLRVLHPEFIHAQRPWAIPVFLKKPADVWRLRFALSITPVNRLVHRCNGKLRPIWNIGPGRFWNLFTLISFVIFLIESSDYLRWHLYPFLPTLSLTQFSLNLQSSLKPQPSSMLQSKSNTLQYFKYRGRNQSKISVELILWRSSKFSFVKRFTIGVSSNFRGVGSNSWSIQGPPSPSLSGLVPKVVKSILSWLDGSIFGQRSFSPAQN